MYIIQYEKKNSKLQEQSFKVKDFASIFNILTFYQTCPAYFM